jgi:CheY-like chemotaxis protein
MAGKDRINILIVDDNEDMLAIYESMFRDEARYSVDMMSDAMQALRRIGEKDYDLIILDIIMEPLTGESFFVYLRSDERTMHIPVIAVTVLEPDMVETLKKVDNSQILQKPIRKEDLMSSIEKCLESSS